MVVASVLCVKSASSGASDGVFCGQGAVAPSIVKVKSASDGRAVRPSRCPFSRGKG